MPPWYWWYDISWQIELALFDMEDGMELTVTRIKCERCSTYFELPGIAVEHLRALAIAKLNWEVVLDETTNEIVDYCDRHRRHGIDNIDSETILGAHYAVGE